MTYQLSDVKNPRPVDLKYRSDPSTFKNRTEILNHLQRWYGHLQILIEGNHIMVYNPGLDTTQQYWIIGLD